MTAPSPDTLIERLQNYVDNRFYSDDTRDMCRDAIAALQQHMTEMDSLLESHMSAILCAKEST